MLQPEAVLYDSARRGTSHEKKPCSLIQLITDLEHKWCAKNVDLISRRMDP